MDDRRTMGDYLDMDYDYDDYYCQPLQQNPCNNDWWKTQYSYQNQYHESSYFQADQGRSNESSIDEKLGQIMDQHALMLDQHALMLDQMMEMLKEGFKQEEINSKAISTLENQVEQMLEQLRQQPLDDFPDSMLADEVTILCNDNFFDINVHEPTPSDSEVVVEGCVSSDEEVIEQEIINHEKAEIKLETSQIVFRELEKPKVGEVSVDDNTNPYPTIFKKPKKQLFVDFIGMDLEKSCKYKQPYNIIDRPFLETIYAKISSYECVIDVIFGNNTLRLLPFGPTNDLPISGDLFVINTIDDYANEHTAYMLLDNAIGLENFSLCNRPKTFDYGWSQHVNKRIRYKKHDVTFSRKSKMKVLHNLKLRVTLTRRKGAWQFEKRFKRSRGRPKDKTLEFYKFKEGMPYDPGKIQEYESLEDKGHYLMPYLSLATQSPITDYMVGFQKSQLMYDPP